MRPLTDLLLPARVILRRGASADVGAELVTAGIEAGTVLVVTDRILRSLGLADPLIAGLTSAGYEPVVFDGVEGEPEAEGIRVGISLARDLEARAIVGIGGGSALDTAKLIALATHSATPLEQFKGPTDAVPGFPPLVLLPTTVGTGAEATRIAMFSIDGQKRAVSSRQFVPRLAVLDPDLVSGLPGPVVAATALDALSHAVESMLSTASDDVTELVALEAARIILDRLPAGVDGDQDARERLMYASFLAGVALNAGVVLGHSVSYVLALQHHVAHGVGCALALPYTLAYDQAVGDSVAQRVLERPDATLRDLAEAIEQLTARVGLPTATRELTGDQAAPADLAALLLREYPRPTNPVPLEEGRLTTLFATMATGDLDTAWKELA